jgi:hypothetical protein
MPLRIPFLAFEIPCLTGGKIVHRPKPIADELTVSIATNGMWNP